MIEPQKFVIVASLCFAVAGCQTYYAKEKIDLSPAVKAQLKNWQTMVNPISFVVSADGRRAN